MKSSKRVEVRTLSVQDVQGRDARCRGSVEREGMLASMNESMPSGYAARIRVESESGRCPVDPGPCRGTACTWHRR